jgi:lipoyl(octanoyl) transferase
MLQIKTFASPQPYLKTIAKMEKAAENIRKYGAPEQIWLLQHPNLYTRGISAKDDELLDPARLPVYESGRGGKFTFHGIGQRIGYIMLNLPARSLGVKAFISLTENWLIDALSLLSVPAFTKPGLIGVWVNDNGEDKKIAAIGVRILHGVSTHGFALNVSPDMTHFKGIIPCGLKDCAVTSLAALGVRKSLAQVDSALRQTNPF